MVYSVVYDGFEVEGGMVVLQTDKHHNINVPDPGFRWVYVSIAVSWAHTTAFYLT